MADSKHTPTKPAYDELVNALSGCQKILAVLIDPANKSSGINNMVAWASCVAAERRAHNLLQRVEPKP